MSMLRWAGMFAGLLVWAGHFAIVYALASLEALIGHGGAVRFVGGTLSALCVAICVWLLVRAARPARTDDLRAFEAALAGGSAVLGALAICWQTLVFGF